MRRHESPLSAAFRLLLIPVLLLLSGCATGRWLGDPRQPYPPPHPPKVGDIYNVPTGVYVDESQMLRAVTSARVVFVGETHDNPASHRLELQVLRALSDRYPGRVAMGMEMFTPQQQPVLDRWVRGELSEKEFLRQSRWYDVWGMDFDYYKALLEFARGRRIPVLGLNADMALQNAVRKKNVSQLSLQSRRELAELDLDRHLDNPYRRAQVDSVLSAHHVGQTDASAFLRVQTLWDEIMGTNAARYLASPEGKDHHLLVVAGSGHINYGFGIPRVLFRRFPTSYALVGTDEIVIPPEKRKELINVPTPRYPMPPYDFVVYAKYESLKKEPVHLGVSLREEKGKVVVEGVAPGSAAAAAGIKKGDRLVSFDGEPVKDMFDVMYPLTQKRPGQRARLKVERAGKTLELTVAFPSHKGAAHPAEGK